MPNNAEKNVIQGKQNSNINCHVWYIACWNKAVDEQLMHMTHASLHDRVQFNHAND